MRNRLEGPQRRLILLTTTYVSEIHYLIQVLVGVFIVLLERCLNSRHPFGIQGFGRIVPIFSVVLRRERPPFDIDPRSIEAVSSGSAFADRQAFDVWNQECPFLCRTQTGHVIGRVEGRSVPQEQLRLRLGSFGSTALQDL